MNTAEIAQLKGAVGAGRTIMYQSHSLTGGGQLKRVVGFHQHEDGRESANLAGNNPGQGAYLDVNGPGAFFELTRLFPGAS